MNSITRLWQRWPTPAASAEGTTDHEPLNMRWHDEQDSSDRLEENGADMDQAPLTVVSYKKKRGSGVPVVFRPTVKGGCLWKVNTNIVASAVLTSALQKFLNHPLNKGGNLVVTASTPPLQTVCSLRLPGHADTIRAPVRHQDGHPGPFKSTKRHGAALTLTRRACTSVMQRPAQHSTPTTTDALLLSPASCGHTADTDMPPLSTSGNATSPAPTTIQQRQRSSTARMVQQRATLVASLLLPA
ncbi:hypothetical protein HPB51_004124 [Rhipicephalus microplus]|uniref:Uncharacterized protein n=1 Tax=Rhipicephalus microplus TaxID=6941 RepID=A0A9J6EXF6_RHIMP|nr:hypothetical protein HPB51_004124 [Rhipicephalus microplus]